MILLKQMSVLFLLMMIGFVCRKKGIFTDEASKKISSLVVNVANPALILSAGINPANPVTGKKLFLIMLLALGVFGVLIILAFVIPKLLGVSKKDNGVYKVMLIFSNIGFMGFPLIAAVYGSDALLYGSLFVIPYNVLIYTYGIGCMKTPERETADKSLEASSDSKSRVLSVLKKILNIGVLACILSIICYVSRVQVPSILESTITYLSGLTAPLSMMIIGDSMTKLNIKELVTDWRLMVFTAIKLLVIPIVGVFILLQLGMSTVLAGVCMIMLATPIGSMTVMLAQEYGGDYALASKGVALTTVLSVVTIPLVSMILGI